MATTYPTRRPRGAFTLIELLVVIVVIGVLLTLVVAVGTKVVGGGKTSLTQDLIRTLDQSLDSYMGDNNNEAPPAIVADPEDTDPDDPRMIPVVDGVVMPSRTPINSVGLYMLEAARFNASDSILQGIGADHVRRYKPVAGGNSVGLADEQPELATVFDAWGQPIRFVHPKFDGEIVESERVECQPGTGVRMNNTDKEDNGYFFGKPNSFYMNLAFTRVRRNFITTRERDPDVCANQDLLVPGDADGGLTVGGRPYFYSAGPDGDPSDRADNVYSTEPRFLPDRE
jgi:prepilin-type N-terminal cleavage/methylation domain-containing protein